ncbi:hypothetical protein ACHAWF_016795 [Thalassiosira exigua]
MHQESGRAARRSKRTAPGDGGEVGADARPLRGRPLAATTVSGVDQRESDRRPTADGRREGLVPKPPPPPCFPRTGSTCGHRAPSGDAGGQQRIYYKPPRSRPRTGWDRSIASPCRSSDSPPRKLGGSAIGLCMMGDGEGSDNCKCSSAVAANDDLQIFL